MAPLLFLAFDGHEVQEKGTANPAFPQGCGKQKAHSQEWAFCMKAGAGSGNRTRIISLEG